MVSLWLSKWFSWLFEPSWEGEEDFVFSGTKKITVIQKPKKSPITSLNTIQGKIGSGVMADSNEVSSNPTTVISMDNQEREPMTVKEVIYC